MISISEKIQALRKARNLTQEALGELVSVSAQAISKWDACVKCKLTNVFG